MFNKELQRLQTLEEEKQPLRPETPGGCDTPKYASMENGAATPERRMTPKFVSVSLQKSASTPRAGKTSTKTSGSPERNTSQLVWVGVALCVLLGLLVCGAVAIAIVIGCRHSDSSSSATASTSEKLEGDQVNLIKLVPHKTNQNPINGEQAPANLEITPEGESFEHLDIADQDLTIGTVLPAVTDQNPANGEQALGSSSGERWCGSFFGRLAGKCSVGQKCTWHHWDLGTSPIGFFGCENDPSYVPPTTTTTTTTTTTPYPAFVGNCAVLYPSHDNENFCIVRHGVDARKVCLWFETPDSCSIPGYTHHDPDDTKYVTVESQINDCGKKLDCFGTANGEQPGF